MMTNKDWLCSLTAEEFFDTYYYVIHTKGQMTTDTRLFMIDWLNEERKEGNDEPGQNAGRRDA